MVCTAWRTWRLVSTLVVGFWHSKEAATGDCGVVKGWLSRHISALEVAPCIHKGLRSDPLVTAAFNALTGARVSRVATRPTPFRGVNHVVIIYYSKNPPCTPWVGILYARWHTMFCLGKDSGTYLPRFKRLRELSLACTTGY